LDSIANFPAVIVTGGSDNILSSDDINFPCKVGTFFETSMLNLIISLKALACHCIRELFWLKAVLNFHVSQVFLD